MFFCHLQKIQMKIKQNKKEEVNLFNLKDIIVGYRKQRDKIS
jgi:hypothetical protein